RRDSGGAGAPARRRGGARRAARGREHRGARVSTVTAGLVKELRDLTGAGMMDCKRALEETAGDVEAAQKLLREKGIAAAGKRSERETTEGVVLARVGGGIGTMVAVGCE